MADKEQQNDNKHSQQEEALGLAGGMAKAFIHSPLSPLFFFAMLFMGGIGVLITPRQEDPQISVPMVDIFIQYPGASAEEVASKAIDPLERMMSEITGVEHVYSAAQRGQGIVTVQFFVGEEMNDSLVKLHDKLQSNMDKIPAGVRQPLVKPKSIDDVAVVNITLWSKDLDEDGDPDVDDAQLRLLSLDVLQSLKEITNTGKGFIVGGRSEQVRVEIMPDRLSGHGMTLDQVANTIKSANTQVTVGDVEAGGTHFQVETGEFLRSADDVKNLILGSYQGQLVYVRDVAKVTQAPEDTDQLVTYYTGAAYAGNQNSPDGMPAVTIAVAKKQGSNGVVVANDIISKVEQLQHPDVGDPLIPSNVEVAITRDYGKTAGDKVTELILKIFKATGAVIVLIIIAFRALKPAFVVFLVIPVVVLFTIFIAYLMGYTIDRVSLFALIFAIGILVDDAIVVVENIYRRWLEEGKMDAATAIDAVREVGNPTILATFTVIAALLPMGFVRGMMGPYMEPIPALGSVAMLVSLFAAFVFTPWLTVALKPSMSYLRNAEKREHEEAEKLEKIYRKILTPLISSPAKKRLFKLVLWGAFFAACSMFYFKLVTVKMLPLDNKPEFSVVIDMPEGTALPETANLTHHMASKLREIEEVTAIQTYVGTARPFDFNGMVRHYYLRNKPWHADIQIQLLDKTERKRSSHEIALQARELLTKSEVVQATGVKFSVVEMPPGPPVLQSVVAEIYGPDQETRIKFAQDVTEMFKKSTSITDVDNYLEEPYYYKRFVVDKEKASRLGISVQDINRNLSMAMGDFSLGTVKKENASILEPTKIIIQVPLGVRSDLAPLLNLPIRSQSGKMVSLAELGEFEEVLYDRTIYHKDLRSVEYVVGDVTGEYAAPVYGMLDVHDELANYTAPDGTTDVSATWLGPPENDAQAAFAWAGEWTVTYETFRDMGIAFCVALILIYVLVVWEFGNFKVPGVIMAPIPLTLLGIIPAHALMGAEFTATSMIGWIALAGIIVRNSILLVDFSLHEVQKGTPVEDAVILSCKTRTRPIVITAFALVAGSMFILSDPIFNGMAISLAAGVLVSTLLTLIVIPLGCMDAKKSICDICGVPVEHHGLGDNPKVQPAVSSSKETAYPHASSELKSELASSKSSTKSNEPTGVIRHLEKEVDAQNETANSKVDGKADDKSEESKVKVAVDKSDESKPKEAEVTANKPVEANSVETDGNSGEDDVQQQQPKPTAVDETKPATKTKRSTTKKRSSTRKKSTRRGIRLKQDGSRKDGTDSSDSSGDDS